MGGIKDNKNISYEFVLVAVSMNLSDHVGALYPGKLLAVEVSGVFETILYMLKATRNGE